jgi:hypothetical protein
VLVNSANARGVVAVLSGDLTGDGRPDVVARTSINTILLFPTQSDGSIGTGSLLYHGTSLSDVVIADVNGDGHPDVIVAERSPNSLVVILSNGDGSFAAPLVTPLSFEPTQIAAGDFNSDGKKDVAVRSASGPLFVVLSGDGAGNFAEISRLTLAGSPYALVTGDIDGDGHADVLIANNNPIGYQLYFGKGDGTFDMPVTVPGAPSASSKIILADLDGDGDLEIISCEFAANSVTVVVNLGSRAFSAPAAYNVLPANAFAYGNPFDLVVLDATDDGKPDVIVSLSNERLIATLPGNGDGSLGTIQYSAVSFPTYPESLTAADFTGDGRVDVVMSTGEGRVRLFRNASGESAMSFRPQYPTLSVGQTQTFLVQVVTPAGFLPRSPYEPPLPTGAVTLTSGMNVIGSGSLQDGGASIDMNSVPLGIQTVGGNYAGDLSFRAATSPTTTFNVVNDSTTATLTSNAPPGPLPYGVGFTLTGNVTSTIPGPGNGSFWLYTDNQRSQNTSGGSPAYWFDIGQNLPPGTHTLYIKYDGTATQPPSSASNVITQVIRKAGSITTIEFPPFPVRYGDQPTIRVSLSGNPFGGVPGGNVRLLEGNAVLATTVADPRCCSGRIVVNLTLPVLAAGVHYIHATYEGDQNFEPSVSALWNLRVLPNAALVVQTVANSSSVGAYGVLSLPIAGYEQYKIYRRIETGSWTVVTTTNTPSWQEPNAAPSTVYTYRMEVYDLNTNQLIASSNTDSAMMVSFTDDPILPTTVVKALHLTELLNATNAFRAGASLPPITLSGVAVGQRIQATTITTLRTALNEARVALGDSPVTFSTNVAPGSLIRIQDVQDLREAVR